MNIKIKQGTIEKWYDLKDYQYVVGLNNRLIDSQDLDDEGISKVFATHGKKLFLFNKAKDFLQELADIGTIDKTNQDKLVKFNDDLEQLEYQAQEAWGFNKDPDHHIWWLDMPGCNCPVMDNTERVGTGRYIHIGSCPWHGGFAPRAEI
jgi:hypothetical protein